MSLEPVLKEVDLSYEERVADNSIPREQRGGTHENAQLLCIVAYLKDLSLMISGTNSGCKKPGVKSYDNAS